MSQAIPISGINFLKLTYFMIDITEERVYQTLRTLEGRKDGLETEYSTQLLNEIEDSILKEMHTFE